MKNLIPFIILLTALTATGCEESASSFSYERQVVVTGLLEAGNNVDTLKLVYTGEVDKTFSPSAYAVTNAVVKIIGTDVAFTDSLVHDPSNPGRYYSTDPSKIILPTKSYRLDVRTADGKSITATTTVPDTFSMLFSTLKDKDTVRYDVKKQVNIFAWTPSRLHGTYLPTVWSTDSNAALIPKSFRRDTVDVPKPDKLGYRVGLPKEQTYTELPWIFLSYYGTTKIDVYAVDENYSSFLNQFVAGQGGELREIRYNIQGGIGVFGARTKAFGGISVYLVP
ncbi:MAG: DUF4249 family protein [Bacteroidetes bacterium]|nr:DUF4249 family protein [Bacteroidota bacterium]